MTHCFYTVLKVAVKFYICMFILYTGDAECLSGSCTNGTCGLVEGQVTCMCNVGFMKDDNGLCVETGTLQEYCRAAHKRKDFPHLKDEL